MVVVMYFKPRLSRERKRPIIWMASHHFLTSSTSSSFCISQNDLLSSQPTIQIQKYQNILGLSLKIEVRDKKQRKRRENHNSFKPHVYVFTEGVAGTKNKTFRHCLQKRFISV